jgi:hypothetical protein
MGAVRPWHVLVLCDLVVIAAIALTVVLIVMRRRK